MITVTATVHEADQPDGAKLVISPADAARLSLTSGQTVALEVHLADTPSEASVDDGVVVSDADFAAMKREIAALAAQDVRGGTSPTLERLIREAEAQGRVARV